DHLGGSMRQRYDRQRIHNLANLVDLHGVADVAHEKADQVLGLVVAVPRARVGVFHRFSRGSTANRIRMSLGSSRSWLDERPRVRTARGRPMPITYSLRSPPTAEASSTSSS